MSDPEIKLSSKPSGFAQVIILIVVLVVAIGIGAYFFFKTASPARVPMVPAIVSSTTPSAIATTTKAGSSVAVNIPHASLAKTSIPVIAGESILYPSFSWMSTTTSILSATSSIPQSNIVISSGKNVGFVTLSGQEWISLVDASTSGEQSANFQKYYKDLYDNYATNIGEYNSVQMDTGDVDLGQYEFQGLGAGGLGGGDWSYLFKSGFYEQANPMDYTKDIIQEVTLFDRLANADGSLCRSDKCPYIEYGVFLSDPMIVGDVIASATTTF